MLSTIGVAFLIMNLVGEDGMKLAGLWWSIAQDPMQRTSDRLQASRLLANRGWGRAALFAPREGDPVGWAGVEQAAEEFRGGDRPTATRRYPPPQEEARSRQPRRGSARSASCADHCVTDRRSITDMRQSRSLTLRGDMAGP